MSKLTEEQLLSWTKYLRKETEELTGIDAEKVHQTVSSYLQIARDNELNYIEFLQVFAVMKETVLQSLNKISISALPTAISDTANE